MWSPGVAQYSITIMNVNDLLHYRMYAIMNISTVVLRLQGVFMLLTGWCMNPNWRFSRVQADEKPDVAYSDIGGLDMQKQEIKEAVELPLTHFDLYKQIGIDPPRGVLMFGPPGCGKTMLAKAVAHHTTASFIRVVGSEFVQKYLGEGPRMVRDVFRLARENAPAIIFIDEIDAIATKRFDAQTGADREVQRILLELLNQMDGFDQTTNVKVRLLLCCVQVGIGGTWDIFYTRLPRFIWY